MATVEDVTAFKAKWSGAFNAVPDGDVAAVLDETDIWLDSRQWQPRDFPLARMLWAAHSLQLFQLQRSSALGAATGLGSADLFVRSVGFGERRVMFGERRIGRESAAGGPGDSLLQTTIYGLQFLQLRARNFPAVLTV